MKLWRISNYDDLKGSGGLIAPGRWHNRGIPVVYLAESPALAMLEILVNFELELDEIPSNYQLLDIESGETTCISTLSDKSLPVDWASNVDLTRAIGDEWLSSLKSPLLRVPSAIVPHSYNYLLNPRHEAASQVKIIRAQLHPFDRRLS